MPFADLGLAPDILLAVREAGYAEPTPIQSLAIPHVLSGVDIVGLAQTGTGKTAGFTLPMIHRLAAGRGRARMPRALILEPTRELAAQVAENFETYGRHTPLGMTLLIGGTSFADQEASLRRGPDVLIATPGRLIDFFERGRILLADIQMLVIDEADRMLDMGFIPDVEKIIKLLPSSRQTLMFSATMPPEIRRLAQDYLSRPQEVAVARSATTAEGVTQELVTLTGDFKTKRAALRQLLTDDAVRSAIIFCNRKRDVAILDRSLRRHGFNAAALHGDMDQTNRMQTLERFRDSEISFLVASDVAARGLDIDDIGHVFNFDVPRHAEDYVHRIGRTGRAGKEGRALTIATPEDTKALTAIEKLLGKKIPRRTAPDVAEVRKGRATGKRTASAGPARSTPDSSVATRSAPARRTATPGTPTPGTETGSTARRGSRAKSGSARAETPKPADRSQRPAPVKSGRRARPAENGEAGAVVTGMGDHIPAFLLR